MKIYTVIAKKGGDAHNHRYLVGHHSTKDLARVVELAEEQCEISEYTLDKVDSDVIDAYPQDTGE